jgi:hypothetical protein
MADKDFVVKNGLVVNTNLILANSSLFRVGIACSSPDAVLTVGGTANVQGVATVTGNVFFGANATVSSNLYVSNYANVVGSANVGGTFGVTGAVTFAATANVGANIQISTTRIFIGNSISSVFTNSSFISVGNSTVNSTINSTAISGVIDNANRLGGLSATDFITATGSQTRSGNSTFNANVILGSSSIAVGVQANSSYGNPGDSLISNGTATYWAIPPVGANSLGGTGGIQYYNGTQQTYPSGASPALSFNDTSNSLSVGNTIIVGGATVNSTIYTGKSYDSNQLEGRGASSYVNTSGAYTISGAHTRTGETTFNANATVNRVFAFANAISANGGNGTSGHVLTSAASGNAYWARAVNTDAQYIWTNTTTFSNSVTITNSVTIGNSSSTADLSIFYTLTANGVSGEAGQFLTSAGASGRAYWKTPLNSNSTGGVGSVQFHNGTTFGSAAGLTFSASSNSLSVANSIIVGTATLNSTSFPGKAGDSDKLGGLAASGYVNSTGAYTFSGVHIHNANISIAASSKLLLDGVAGIDGQVVGSNSAGGIYWRTLPAGTVTAVKAGNGISTASTFDITGSGTLYVDSGNGLITDADSVRVRAGNSSIVSNTTGVWIGDIPWSKIYGQPAFFSGVYADLTSKPTLFSGSYNDLTNKPTIPTKTSDITNDSGYIGTAGLSTYALKAAPTFTGLTTVAGLRITGSYYTSITTLGSGTSFSINCALGNYFTATSTGTTTISFSGAPASGNLYSMIIRLTGGGNYTVAWPASVKWQGAVAPTPTTNTDIWVFSTDDGGTSWRGNLTLKDYR